MDGFKDSSKTVWIAGGYAKGGAVKRAEVSKVMHEFKAGTLHSGSKKGPEVSSRKQAVAIAMSEAGKTPVKKSLGGVLEAGAGYLSGGIPGLLSSLAAQRRRKEEADATKAAATPLTAASGIPDKKPDEMARGGRARKGSQTPLINKAGPPRSLLESKACGGSPRKKG